MYDIPIKSEGERMIKHADIDTSIACRFSPEDEDLAKLKWWPNPGGYPSRSGYLGGAEKRKNYVAHRLVAARMIGRLLSKDEIVDHINFDRKDCRRDNLRILNHAQSRQHVRAKKGSRSGLRGAFFYKRDRKWIGLCTYLGKRYVCGRFDTPEAAANAATRKRIELGFADHSTPSLIALDRTATTPDHLKMFESRTMSSIAEELLRELNLNSITLVDVELCATIARRSVRKNVPVSPSLATRVFNAISRRPGRLIGKTTMTRAGRTARMFCLPECSNDLSGSK